MACTASVLRRSSRRSASKGVRGKGPHAMTTSSIPAERLSNPFDDGVRRGVLEEVCADEGNLGAARYAELRRESLELRSTARRQDDAVSSLGQRASDGDAETSRGAHDEHLTTRVHDGVGCTAHPR